jgi:hypothetical protein
MGFIVRHKDIHTAQPLVPEPRFVEVGTATEKFQSFPPIDKGRRFNAIF